MGLYWAAMVFSYYSRLNRRQKAIYRSSDRWAEVELPDPHVVRAAADDIREALAADIAPAAQRFAVRKASTRLARAICEQLDVEPLNVKVLARRPRSAESELHGLYVWEEGLPAEITVWMRTAQKRQVVAFKTFLRTLLHEICHHLDYHMLELSDSFHTEGFFKRENHLARQILPDKERSDPKAQTSKSAARTDQKAPAQLKLPLS